MGTNEPSALRGERAGAGAVLSVWPRARETPRRRRMVLLPGVPAVSRPALPEERGADLRPDPPTLDELRRAHDWRTEERAEGRYVVDGCQQCGHEESVGSRGPVPDCKVREVPFRLVSLAKRHNLLPETSGARNESMTGVPSGAAESQG